MKRCLLLVLLATLVPQLWAASSIITTNGTTCVPATNCLVYNMPQDDGGATLTVSGTWTGTISFEATGDGGTTWVAVNVMPLNSTTAVTSTTANGTWQVNTAGFTGLRMRGSATMTGSALATINPSAASARNGGSSGGSGGSPGGSGSNLQGRVNSTTFGGVAGSSFSSGGGIALAPGSAVGFTVTGDSGSDDIADFNANGGTGGSAFKIDSGGNVYITNIGVAGSTLLDIDSNSEINTASVDPPLAFANDTLTCPACPLVNHEINQGGPVTVNGNTTGLQQLQVMLPDQGWSAPIGILYDLKNSGIFSVTGTPTVTITLKLCAVQDCSSGAAVTLATLTSAAVISATNNRYLADVNCITNDGGASATYYCHGTLTIDLTGSSSVAATYTDANTGATSPIDATVQLYPSFFVSFSSGSTSNSMTSQITAMLPL